MTYDNFENSDYLYAFNELEKIAEVRGFSGRATLQGAIIKDVVKKDNVDYKIVSVGEKAFQNKGLEYVILGENINHILKYAFIGNFITKVTIPENVLYIGFNAFSNNHINTVIFNSGEPICESEFLDGTQKTKIGTCFLDATGNRIE